MTERATPAVVEARDVSVRYGDTQAVHRASLSVSEGQVVALVGPSGCGKTSLLRVVAGFERPAGGEVRIDGYSVAGDGVWVAPEKRRVGMVFQQGALFPHMTVRDNVGYGVGRGNPGLTDEALRLVGLAELGARFPDQLSGGQQQLVALARALAPSPRIVLLDEPFANLDASLRRRLRREVRRVLERARATAILVTHDQQEALSLADRVAVMSQGRILQVGTPREVYERPDRIEVAEFIGGGTLLACRIEGGRIDGPLGMLHTAEADGEASLLVRGEDLRLRAAGTGPGVEGVVEEARFEGHETRISVRLAGGPVVPVRLPGAHQPPPGSAVRLELRTDTLRLFRNGRPGVACVKASGRP